MDKRMDEQTNGQTYTICMQWLIIDSVQTWQISSMNNISFN